MGYRVKGTLKLPDGSPASNAEIEFISRKNFSPLVQELKSNILCGLDGAYDVTLELGEYAVMVYPGGTYPEALGTIVLAADTVAGQDLPTLLQQSGWQPATPEYIQQIATWLAEANASATSSAASASAAKVSETNAAASASTVAGAVTTHEGKAGAHPISGVTNLQTALDSKANKATTLAGYGITDAEPKNPSLYQKSNVVGVVSQSGGVPTGAVIERGSNANGEYTKLADGTLLISLETLVAVQITTPWGALFRSAAKAVVYPAVFVGPYAWGSFVKNWSSAFVVLADGTISGQNSNNIYVISPYAGVDSSGSYVVGYQAQGRWY